MILRFSIPALSEIEEIRDWYDQRESGLGNKFLADLRDALESIESHPHGCPLEETNPSDRDVRRRMLHTFPFRVIFEMQVERVYVLTVAHHHRQPGYWSERLED